MKFYISTTIIFLLLFICNITIAQAEIDKGWQHWTNGDIPQAQSVAENILKKTPTDNEALHLQSLCLCVQGKYQGALAAFHLIDSAYAEYEEVGRAMVDAYIHLNEPENAFKLAKQLKLEYSDYYRKLAEKPFICKANKTFIIPFNNDPNLQIHSKFFPSVDGKINGKEVNIGFDTGAPFLVIGKEAAEELGISLGFKFIGKHGPRSVTHWRGIAEKLQLGDGLVFKNVPVAIAESLGQQVIFGTNILEQFLATIDYPNSRFILTPRNRKDLYPKHLALLPKKQEILPFYMWPDHYMFAKGSFNNIDGLNFFFDSGLVALADINGKIKQAPFTASKEKLISWGFDESKLNNSTFFPTEYPLAVKNLIQENTLIWYDVNFEKDSNYGGVRMDGLISHAFFCKYSWTIDFDKHEYIFGIY
ncbi:MAG: retroviral-like aspartic protease family protein [Planctomycetota bacterium]|jgi:tetratricopeptide (TPR) repeat protein